MSGQNNGFHQQCFNDVAYPQHYQHAIAHVLHQRNIPAAPQSFAPPVPFGSMNDEPLLSKVRALPPTRRRQLILAAFHLKRPNIELPWGLSLSMFGDYIILGNVGPSVSKHQAWSQVMLSHDHLPDPLRVYQPANVTGESPQVYAKKLKTHLTGMGSKSAEAKKHARFFPGDLLVAIDGHMPSHFRSLSDFTSYLRQASHITLIVVRKAQATAIATSFYDGRIHPIPPPDTPYRASSAACQVWSEEFGPPIRLHTPMPQLSNIQRVVTPGSCASYGDPREAPSPRAVSYGPVTSSHQPQSYSHTYPVRALFPSSNPLSNPAVASVNPLDLLSKVALSANMTCQSFDRAKMSSTAILRAVQKLPPQTPTTVTKRNMMSSSGPSIPNTHHSFQDKNNQDLRPELFLSPTEDFPSWLRQRKQQWRSRYKVYNYKHNNKTLSKHGGCREKSVPKDLVVFDSGSLSIPDAWRNPWFQKDGQNIPFSDNWEFSPEDGRRADLFLPPIVDFPSWLQNRKQQWRSQYKVYKHQTTFGDEDDCPESRTVAKDFWSPQGYTSFDDWMVKSVSKWKALYSWNQRKRKRIQQECETVVHLTTTTSTSEFRSWLQVRRNQWRLLRRKRQRRKQEAQHSDASPHSGTPETMCLVTDEATTSGELGSVELVTARKRLQFCSAAFKDFEAIDDILEEEERKRKALEDRPPIDISFLFDASKGAPDDVVVHCLEFLENKDYWILLCINRKTSSALKARENVWRQLCPTHWVLPRRPRKPWHELYFHKLRVELQEHQKRWDDLLLKCQAVLSKGDHLQKFEKLIRKGEEDFGFTVNYVSPVVCERNSLLNLAVISQRHKIVRWLVDEKGADIESYDRGWFTPLMNAAWGGDRQLVRLFLQHGADRTKVGTGHSSRALAHPDFEGLTAEGWALKRGHEEIAALIRYGL